MVHLGHLKSAFWSTLGVHLGYLMEYFKGTLWSTLRVHLGYLMEYFKGTFGVH